MANVSPGTVSRVLSGKPGVGDETRQRIQELIESLGYQPNVSAQRLGSRRSWAIGLMLSHATSEVTAQAIFPELIGTLADGLDAANYSLTLFSKAGQPTRRIMQALSQGKVDAVILPDVRVGDEIISYLRSSAFPFVVIGQRFTTPDISWVDTNHDTAIEQLTTLLIEKGHAKIAFINGSEELSSSLLRSRGFQTAMGNEGLAVSPKWMRAGGFSFQSGYLNTHDLLQLPASDRPTAIVAASDLIAMGCLKAASELNLRVPDDLAITGFDDIPVAEHLHPSLTTARHPIHEMGMKATEFILNLLNNDSSDGPDSYQIILPSEVIVRESSG